ncbi:MAG: flagellar filament capping protein FliD [Bryobacteraceae bacterium]|jgi:flagellar hook-associated protein 2
MSTAPITFTGVSTYSSDFQSILARQVSIAQIPITALQNTQSDNQSKVSLLTSLSSAVATLGSTVASLGSIGSNQGLTASSSDTSTVTVSNTGATQATSYTISNITSLASAATDTSVNGYADSNTAKVSSTGSLQLIVGSQAYAINLTSSTNNLNGLESAINASGAPVTATILTTGTGANPNYLSVTADNQGATTLQLNDLPASGPPVALLNGAQPLAETSTSSYANTTSTVSADGSLNLVVNGQKTAITLGAGQNNLTGLAAAIDNSGAGITATISNSGSGSTPYSLVLTANNLGATSLQLTDVPTTGSVTGLLSTTNNNANQGSGASFELNGITVNSPGNTVADVIPGLTFNLLQTTTGSNSGNSVTLSLASDTSSLSNALSSLATNYNAVLNQLASQTGPNAGLLDGDNSVLSVSADLQQLANYKAAGSNGTSLATLGITFSDNGQMSFDPTVLPGLSSSQLTSAFAYLGSATTGFGAIANQLTQLTDPVSGTLATEETGLNTENTDISNHITTLNNQLTTMQTNLTSQLEAADAAVAELESQQTILTSSIDSVDLVLYGQNYGTALPSNG